MSKYAACVFAVLCCASDAVATVRTLTVCVPDQAVPPISFPDRDGLAQSVMRAAAARVNVELSFVVRPRPRCLREVEQGRLDALLPMTANNEFTRANAYPTRNGEVDASRRLLDYTAVLIKQKDGSARWDGRRLDGVRQPVILLAGYRTSQQFLTQLGVAWDTVQTPEQIGRMLIARRAEAAVMTDASAEELLRDARFAGRLEVVSPEFLSAPIYLAFNKRYADAHAELVAQLWAALEHDRQRLVARKKGGAALPGPAPGAVPPAPTWRP